MKKILLLLFYLSTSSLLFSQEKIGLLAGFNVNQTNESFLSGLDSFGFGYHIGAVYNLELTPNISFSPRLLYSKQGDTSETDKWTLANGKLGWGVGSGGLDYELTYLNIPLNFKFYNTTYLLIGPQVGFLLATKKQNIDLGDIENKTDLGINFGIGQKINNFFIELNIYQGLTTLINFEGENNTYSADPFSAKNLVAQVSLGFYLK